MDDFFACDNCGRQIVSDPYLDEAAGQWLCADCLAEQESCECAD